MQPPSSSIGSQQKSPRGRSLQHLAATNRASWRRLRQRSPSGGLRGESWWICVEHRFRSLSWDESNTLGHSWNRYCWVKFHTIQFIVKSRQLDLISYKPIVQSSTSRFSLFSLCLQPPYLWPCWSHVCSTDSRTTTDTFAWGAEKSSRPTKPRNAVSSQSKSWLDTTCTTS